MDVSDSNIISNGGFTEISEHLETFTKFSNSVLRGQKDIPNLDRLKDSANSFLQLSFSVNVVDASESSKLEILNAAVKLYNSIRNLPSTDGNYVSEIKNLIKVGIGFILLRFKAPHNSRSLEICIRLFTAIDLNFLGLDTALKSYEGVICCWELINQNNFLSNLSHSSNQDIKLYSCKAFIGSATLAIELRSSEAVNICRQALVRASEIAQQGMPDSLKVDFAEASLKIGTHLAAVPLVLPQSKQFFSLSITTLTEILQTSSTADSSSSSLAAEPRLLSDRGVIHNLLAKSIISLAYVHMELGEFDRALACVNTIDEPSSKQLSTVILYAKYTISTKDNDWKSADAHFESLLSIDIKFEMAIDCIQNYIKSSGGERESAIDSYFKALASKFSKDHDFNEIRLLQAQYILSHFNNENMSKRAVELVKTIASDHVSRERKLDQNQLDSFLSLIIAKIKLFWSNEYWSMVCLWADIGINLTSNCIEFSSSSSSSSKRTSLELIKSEGLLNLGIYKEAYDLSKEIFLKSRTVKSGIVAFRCGLFFLKPKTEILKFYFDEIETKLNFKNSNIIDSITRSLMLYDICKKCSISNNSEVKSVSVGLLYHLVNQINQVTTSSSAEAIVLLKSIPIQPATLIYVFMRGYLEKYFIVLAKEREKPEPITSNKATIEMFGEENNENNQNLSNVSNVSKNVDIDVDNIELGEIMNVSKSEFGISSFFDYSQVDANCRLDCSLEDFHSFVKILSVFPEFCQDKGDLLTLDDEVIEGIGDMLWNLGIICGREEICQFNDYNNQNESYSCRRQKLAAELHELTARYYSQLKTADLVINSNNQILCYAAASVARLSISSIDSNDVTIGTENIYSTPIFNIRKSINDCELAMNLVRKIAGFQSNLLSAETIGLKDLIVHHHVIAILREHSLLGKKFDNVDLLSQIGLFDLPSKELYELASACELEGSTTIEFIRTLYQIALQTANRESPGSSISVLGKIYRKVIDLSSNKEMALEVITQVVQQLQSNSNQNRDQNTTSDADQMDSGEDGPTSHARSCMAVEDVNNIFCNSYNSGVTLVDLGQYALAREFFDQSTILLNYTSHAQSKMWENFLKDAKKQVLLQLSNNHKPILLTEVGFCSRKQSEINTFRDILHNKPIDLN